MGYKVEIRNGKKSGYSDIYLVDNSKRKSNEFKIGTYSLGNRGVVICYNPVFRVFGGDSVCGPFETLPVSRRFKNFSLEVITHTLFLKFFWTGSELGVLDIEKDRFIPAN